MNGNSVKYQMLTFYYIIFFGFCQVYKFGKMWYNKRRGIVIKMALFLYENNVPKKEIDYENKRKKGEI